MWEDYEDHSAWLEQEDGNLSHVEVDKVLGLVSDVGSEVSANNTVPGGIILLIELFFNIGSDIFFNDDF